MLGSVLSTLESDRQRALDGLLEFLRLPSISTQPDHRPDMQKCAEWLAERLRSAGLAARIEPTGGHPVVLAKNAHQPGRPTVLFYGHYDVQPPEPLELWTTPPFEPSIRNNMIYARGSSDDKGQVWAHVSALEAWHQHGGVPVNLILLIEGEEEIGSDHLADFIRSHRDELRADIAVISDTAQFGPGRPAITCGLRGLLYMEIFIEGADHDLHSGSYGGAVPNPANILCQLLATLHDADGRVNIPGFYDDVVSPTEAERKMWRELPFDEKQYAADLKLAGLSGEKGYSTLERRWVRPTCDINGLTAGYQGAGAKTVIASKASAKVSMRLVPHQDPAKIQAAFEKTLRERCPGNVKIAFAQYGSAPAVLTPLDSPAMKLAAEAMEKGFGVKPVVMREGGSIPVVGLIKEVLEIDTLLLGFALPGSRAHSPDENFSLDAFHAGARTAAALYERLGQLKK